MNTSIGFWDALFGEKISLDLPQPDGTTKKVTVTKRLMKEMIRQGKIRDVTTSIVKVSILGSGPRIPEGCTDSDEIMDALLMDTPLVQVEHWQVGVQVSKEQYNKFLDPGSKELYAMRKHEDKEERTFLVQRSLWEQARQAMES